ncbi:MAG: SDR family NAD(P)-dependent oxidoreductase, partial [Clostridia bacterium]|nr:SDR family NAD(P)-dependent oxidoreductase [Clostridia bacterium]
MTFFDKVAVITGAGGTLCSEIALDLAKNGTKVVLVGRTKEKLDVVADKIREYGGESMVYPCDVT